ncbi:MAG: hypothetical protein DMF98_08285 [Acidobacteria bacterium]|nr:MAG: hypothetical protein DMF98_08285 [Acidobacteriota bacterium]
MTDPRAPCDLAIAWDTNTFRDRMPALERLQNSAAVWTLRCVDIGKPRVDSAFREAPLQVAEKGADLKLKPKSQNRKVRFSACF